MVKLMRYIALCAVIIALVPAPARAVHAETEAGTAAAPNKPAGNAASNAPGEKELDPTLREAAGRQLTLRDPGFTPGEQVVILPPSAKDSDNRHKWLLGLGIVLLVVAFYMTTRSRDAAPQDGEANGGDRGGDDDQDGARPGESEDTSGDGTGNGHTKTPHERDRGDG